MGRLEEEVPSSTRIFGVRVSYFFYISHQTGKPEKSSSSRVPAGRGYVSSLEGICFFELVSFENGIKPKAIDFFGKFHANDSYRAM